MSAKRVPRHIVEEWGPLLDEGLPYKEIARMYGVHPVTVANHYPGRGWSRKECQELGTLMRAVNQRLRKYKQ